jgi:uncharacterized NAD(P)/FAD-binding protein YdhS
MSSTTSANVPRVAIVGGGASGALVATHLLAQARGPLRVVIIEPHGPLGAGVAYRTDHPAHRLNVPAGRMSAFSHRPDDFVRWLAAEGTPVAASEFVSRSLYRRYLAWVLEHACADPAMDRRLEWVRDEAVAIGAQGDGRWRLVLAGGGAVLASTVVLAIGTPPPRPLHLPGLLPGDPRCVDDPWRPGALQAVAADDVLLVGTGLTMVDVAIALDNALPPERRIHARSRHGLLPRAHTDNEAVVRAARLVQPPKAARALVRLVVQEARREAARGGDWRVVVGQFREVAPRLWTALPLAEKRRMLRHGARLWEIHRHRMAPAVALRLEALLAAGRLTAGRGRIATVRPQDGHLHVTVRHGDGPAESLRVGTIVNCTGPGGDFAASSRLVRSLMEHGLARRDALGMGLDVSGVGDLLGAAGRPTRGIATIGWVRRGQLYETTAVPELRAQAEGLAARLLAEVGGSATALGRGVST